MTPLDSILANLGLLTAGAFSANLETLNVWVPLPMTVEHLTPGAAPYSSTYTVDPPTRDLAAVSGRTKRNVNVGGTLQTLDLVPALIAKNLLRPDPADATKFQLQLGLRVAYPVAKGKPGVVAGKGKLPLVLLSHGHHMNWDAVPPPLPGASAGVVTASDIGVHPSFLGYEYLQTALASNSLISVSIDHNFACFTGSLIETRADTILAALDALATFAATASSRYAGRLDFANIGLMGHSRGGDAVVRATRKIVTDAALAAKYTIKTVCSLAPTDASGADPNGATRITLDTADLAHYMVLYGALDGDVSGGNNASGPVGTGFRHYDRARCPKSMVFLDACCHDFFNTVWTGESQEKGHGDPRLASATDHQSIAVDYIGDLFRWQLAANAQPTRLDSRAPNRVGMHASQQWMFGAAVKRVDDFENPAANLLGAARTVTNPGAPTPLEDITLITVPAIPPAAPTTTLDAHTAHETHVLHIDLTGAPPASSRVLEDAIPATDKDWSGYDTLVVSLAGWFDPTSDATIAAAPLPRMKVTLIDGNGASAAVDWNQYGASLPSRPVFKTLSGSGRNVALMRLETIPLALTLFAGIDRTQIVTLAIDIDPANKTHVIIDNIHAIKR
jgi:hypothetical protein